MHLLPPCRSPLLFLLLLLPIPRIHAQNPEILFALPSPPSPAFRVPLTFNGKNLADLSTLWTSFPLGAYQRTDPTKGEFDLFFQHPPPAGLAAVRLAGPHWISPWQLIVLDPSPAHPILANKNSLTNPQPLPCPLPAAIHGACEEARLHIFQFEAESGDHFHFDILARRLGSPLDPVVRLLDSRGTELIHVEDSPGAGPDVQFSRVFPKGGIYLLELRDARFEGGPQYRFHLRADKAPLPPLPFLATRPVMQLMVRPNPLPALPEAEPNNSPSHAQSLTPPAQITGGFRYPRDRDFFQFHASAGDRFIFSGKTRQMGSPCDLLLRVLLPDGALIAESKVVGSEDGSLTNTFTADGVYHLAIQELAGQHGPALNYAVDVFPFRPGFTLAAEADTAQAAPGDSFELKITAARFDYDGPIQLTVIGLPENFKNNNTLIDAQKKETSLKIQVPDAAFPGQILPFTIRGRAESKADQANETDPFETTISTLAALRKTFPQMLHPPPALDGLIVLGIKTKPPPQPEPSETK